MKKYIYAVLVMMLAVMSSCKEEVSYDMSQPLPLDPNYRIGKLDNGLTYYIRKNNEPKDLVNFYIIQKAGALLEEDNQNGLAHFLEHMAFNGTTHFPDKRIIKMLEAHGVAFGHDINAYTGFDRTVYNLSNIPTNSDTLVDSCLLVLYDWSHNLSLVDKEIDSERGVITEEWRSRNGLFNRISKQTRPVLFEGSQYAKRDIIGDMKVVNGFEHEALRDFYHKWYRPDQQAIAVIGAIDVDSIEKKIIEFYSTIPAPVNPEPLPAHPLKPRTDIGYVCATDKEAVQSAVMIYSVNEDVMPQPITHEYFKERTIISMYNGMLGQRIDDLVRQGSDCLDGGSASFDSFVKNYSSYTVSASAKPNMEREAIAEVYTEVERARRFGFNQTELDRVKASRLTALDNSYQQRDKTSSNTYSSEVISMFIDNEVAVGIEYYTPFMKYVIESITLDDINKAAVNLVSKNNMVIIVTGPDKGVKHASKEDVLSAMDEVEKATLEPYYDEVAGLELITEELEGSEVDDVEQMGVFGAEKWTLENGATVVFAKSDENKNSVSLSAISDGGSSIVKKDDILEAAIAGDLVASFGMGDMDPTLFGKFMAGKSARVSAGISELTDKVGGYSNTKDFELMLQMVYLAFEKPRFDQTQFDIIMSRSATAMDVNRGNPDQIMQDSLSCIMTNYSPRTQLVTGDILRTVKLDDIERVYRDRIKNSADFTFYIVGDIDKDVAKPLVEKYIGAISSSDDREEWIDHNATIPDGSTERRIGIKFQTPKAIFINHIEKNFECEYSRKLAFKAVVLQDVLTQRYTTSIREAEGGSYGVSVGISVKQEPRNVINSTVRFECDPAKVDDLKKLVFKEFETIKDSGVTDAELSGIAKTLIKNIETKSHSNAFVLQSLILKDQYDVDVYDIEKECAIINSITSDDVKELAKMVFNDDANMLTIVFDTKK